MDFSLSQAEEYLNKKFDESVAHLTQRPSLPVKIMGQMTDKVGGKILKRIPPHIFEGVGGLAARIVMPTLSKNLDPISIIDFNQVVRTINRADRIHFINVSLMFTEGSIAGGAGSFASAGGPGAGFAAAVVELPISYLLLLRTTLEVQRAFFITPDLRNANRAFEMASAATIEAKLEAWSKDSESMLSGVLARKLSTKHVTKLAGIATHKIVPLLPNLTVRSATGELSDAGTEQVANSMIQAGLRTYIQRHPQVMAALFPVFGALVGGMTSAMSAKRVLLMSYHLSRLEYIENVRRMLKLQPLLTGSKIDSGFALSA